MYVPVIVEIYAVSALLGALALISSAVMGGMAHGHGGHVGAHGHASAHALGHGPHLHLGHHGHAGVRHAGARGSTHVGRAAGHAASGRAAAGNSQAHAHQAAPRAPSAQARGSGGQTASSNSENASTVPVATNTQPTSEEESVAAKMLLMLNPTVISAFSVWFGVAGILFTRLLPFVPATYTLPLALGGGVFGTKATMSLIGAIASRLHASGSFSQGSIIGLESEVTVGINPGRTGEITCVAGGPRYTISARASDAAASYKRGDHVIIADVRNGIAYVEPWPDDLLLQDVTDDT